MLLTYTQFDSQHFSVLKKRCYALSYSSTAVFFPLSLQERERIRCVECIGHVLSVQVTATAIDRVRSIFNPYCEGLARLVQHQVTL